MSAWRWLWAWFGEPERPARRQAAGPIGDTMSGWGEAAGRRAGGGRTRARGRSRRPLPPATRLELERALGADLADLSLTIDPGFTAALDARAVQLGSTIVLGDPADAQALPLLAHEATHALQARRRGTRPGIGSPGDAGEQAAVRTGAALTAGGPLPPVASGPPVAAIQRQPAPPGKTRGAGERDPAAIQAMLMLAYAKQGGQGDFTWSDELAAAFRRLIPGVALARLQVLWEPPPRSPAEAMARLAAAELVGAKPPPPREPSTPAEPAAPAEIAPEPAPEAAPPKLPEPELPQPEVAEAMPQAMEEEQPAVPPPEALPLKRVAAAQRAELERPVAEPEPVPMAEEARKGLDVTLVVTLPKGLPEAFARAGPELRRGFRLDSRQIRALRSDRSQARQVYDELLARASLEPNVRAGLAELLVDLAWQSSVEAEGAARSMPATAPGAPWRAVPGGLLAKGPFGDLLAALAQRTEVSATLRFRP